MKRKWGVNKEEKKRGKPSMITHSTNGVSLINIKITVVFPEGEEERKRDG